MPNENERKLHRIDFVYADNSQQFATVAMMNQAEVKRMIDFLDQQCEAERICDPHVYEPSEYTPQPFATALSEIQEALNLPKVDINKVAMNHAVLSFFHNMNRTATFIQLYGSGATSVWSDVEDVEEFEPKALALAAEHLVYEGDFLDLDTNVLREPRAGDKVMCYGCNEEQVCKEDDHEVMCSLCESGDLGYHKMTVKLRFRVVEKDDEAELAVDFAPQMEEAASGRA